MTVNGRREGGEETVYEDSMAGLFSSISASSVARGELQEMGESRKRGKKEKGNPWVSVGLSQEKNLGEGRGKGRRNWESRQV